MRPLVILPTYNEALNVAALIQRIRAAVDVEILIVDDNSPDGTGAIVEQIASRDPLVHVLHRGGKLGLASAYMEGFRYALERNYQIIIQMDCDFSHDPGYLKSFIVSIEGRDLVIGSKYVPGGAVIGLQLWRKLLSRYGNLYITSLLRLRDRRFKLHDATSGYMCWRAELLRTLPLQQISCRGYGFLIELKWQAAQLGAAIVEIPIEFRDRSHGRSKLSPNIVLEAFTLPWRLFRL